MNEEKEIIIDEVDNKEPPLFEAEVTYTEEIYKNTYMSFYRKHLIINYIAIVISFLIFLGIMLSETNDAFVMLPILFICIFVGYIIRIKKTTNKAIKTALDSRPNLQSKYSFYEDHFEVNSVSDNSNSTFTKKYSDIKLIKQDSRYIYLTFDGLFSIIDIDSCRSNEEKLYELLNLSKVEQNINKTNKTVKTILLVAFIVSIASIWLALMLVAFSVQSSPIPDFPFAMVEHMWKFFLIIPIPLASLILGIIFTTKGYKCKKNIIVGIIMIVILSIFGTFTNYFSTQISHDTKYLTEISDVTNINIPSNAYISIAYDYQVEGDSLAMVKFNDNSMYDNNIENNTNWKTDVSFIPSDVNNLFMLSLTSNYEYFTVYNTTNNSYNNFDGELIYFAYDVDTNVLFIYCY